MDRGELTSSNVQLRAALEEAELTVLKTTLEETSEEAARFVDGIAGLVDLVTAAEVEVGTTGVTSLADSHVTGDGRESRGRGTDRGSRELGHGEGANGEGKSGGDGELHFESWLGCRWSWMKNECGFVVLKRA